MTTIKVNNKIITVSNKVKSNESYDYDIIFGYGNGVSSSVGGHEYPYEID